MKQLILLYIGLKTDAGKQYSFLAPVSIKRNKTEVPENFNSVFSF